MIENTELASELDRLITEGHQDSSLQSAVLRKFPNTTEAEFETQLEELGAERRLKKKDRLAPDV